MTRSLVCGATLETLVDVHDETQIGAKDKFASSRNIRVNYAKKSIIIVSILIFVHRFSFPSNQRRVFPRSNPYNVHR